MPTIVNSVRSASTTSRMTPLRGAGVTCGRYILTNSHGRCVFILVAAGGLAIRIAKPQAAHRLVPKLLFRLVPKLLFGNALPRNSGFARPGETGVSPAAFPNRSL